MYAKMLNVLKNITEIMLSQISLAVNFWQKFGWYLR